MILNNTRAVLHSAIKRLKRIIVVSDYICQIVLILLCAYNVFSSIGNLVRLIIYSLLSLISVFWLIYTIAYNSDKYRTKLEKKRKNKTNNLIKILKLVFKTSLITYTIIEMTMNGYTTMSLIILIASIVSFMFQIIATIISNQITFYVSNFELAIEQDFSFIFRNSEENHTEKEMAVLNKMKEEFEVDNAMKKDKTNEEPIDIKKVVFNGIKEVIKGKFGKK